MAMPAEGSAAMRGDPRRAHRRQARGLEGGTRLSLAIAPMIDVVFLLLLYFVLTSGFADDERLLRSEAAPSGQEARGAADGLSLEDEPIVITIARVRGATTLRVSGGLAQPDDEQALERVLRDAVLAPDRPNGLFAADHPVRIAPAEDVPWEDVVSVFRAVTAAGFRSIAFGGGA
jgi:biopolymer transport protein ExbD